MDRDEDAVRQPRRIGERLPRGAPVRPRAYFSTNIDVEADNASVPYYQRVPVNDRYFVPIGSVTHPRGGHTRSTVVTNEAVFNASYSIAPSSHATMVYADVGEERAEISSGLEPHPNSGEYSPPCPETELNGSPPTGPLPVQNAHPRQNSDSSGSGSPHKQEECRTGLQAIVPSGERHCKEKPRFSYHQVGEEEGPQAEEDRLATFSNWSMANEMKVPKRRLARAGFKYTGRGDKVICARCKKTLKGWSHGDDPKEEHRKWYGKDCF